MYSTFLLLSYYFDYISNKIIFFPFINRHLFIWTESKKKEQRLARINLNKEKPGTYALVYQNVGHMVAWTFAPTPHNLCTVRFVVAHGIRYGHGPTESRTNVPAHGRHIAVFVQRQKERTGHSVRGDRRQSHQSCNEHTERKKSDYLLFEITTQ